MRNNRLGNSGLYVSDLSLGAMLFGEDGARSTPEADARRAKRLGCGQHTTGDVSLSYDASQRYDLVG